MPAAVDEMAAHGTIAAEFPLGLAAAAHARARGLLVVCGAPNAIRGSSHNGNASTRDLVARGLVDALTSDYVPNSVLGAAWTLHRLGLVRTCPQRSRCLRAARPPWPGSPIADASRWGCARTWPSSTTSALAQSDVDAALSLSHETGKRTPAGRLVFTRPWRDAPVRLVQ